MALGSTQPLTEMSKIDPVTSPVWPRGHWKGVSGQPHSPAAFYLRERPGTHCTGGWVDPRAGLDGRKITFY